MVKDKGSLKVEGKEAGRRGPGAASAVAGGGVGRVAAGARRGRNHLLNRGVNASRRSKDVLSAEPVDTSTGLMVMPKPSTKHRIENGLSDLMSEITTIMRKTDAPIVLGSRPVRG